MRNVFADLLVYGQVGGVYDVPEEAAVLLDHLVQDQEVVVAM